MNVQIIKGHFENLSDGQNSKSFLKSLPTTQVLSDPPGKKRASFLETQFGNVSPKIYPLTQAFHF